jgi:hypothetical protein
VGSGRTPLQERFWIKVNREGGEPAHMPGIGQCWVWTGAVNNRGYGKILLRDRVVWLAHRVSWLMAFGQPAALILHRCDNHLCVRPSHLFEGTHQDNTQDMIEKNRAWWQG